MNVRSTILFLTLVLISTPMACAQEEQAPAVEEAQDVMAEAVEPSEGPIMVGNKICPVSGEEVGTMGEAFKYEYNGKIYNLCCPMCVKDFKKDPEKYVKIVEDMMAQEAAEGEMPGHDGMVHEQ